MTRETANSAPYILSGYLIAGTAVDEKFTLYSYEVADTISVNFNKEVQSLLISKGLLLPEPGEYLEFAISYSSNSKILKGREISSTITAYSYWADDDHFLDFEEYYQLIESRNQYNFYLKLIIGILLVVLANLVHKRWFSFVDYFERFSEKVNAKVDSISTKSTAYQEYKAQLEEEKYLGAFKATRVNPDKVYRKEYHIQSAQFNLGLFFLWFVILAGAAYYFSPGLGLQESIILFVLYSFQAFISFKKGELVVINEKGIKWQNDHFLAWTDVEFSYLYFSDGNASLLLKLFGKNEPILIPVENLTLTPEQIGSIVAYYTDLRDKEVQS